MSAVPAAPSESPEPVVLPTMGRILIIDDEPANLKLLGMVLRHAGFVHVETLQDSRESVAVYRRFQPDLILLDLNMPHVDGYEVLDQLHALDDPAIPPVVVLTAQCGDGLLLRALQGGAVDYLTKPFNRQELLARIYNILRARLRHRRLRASHESLRQSAEQSKARLDALRVDLLRRLNKASALRDDESGEHVLRMSHLSSLLARRAGWSETDCELMLHASPLHDVGKIGIPDSILLKPGPLTSEERVVMQSHAQLGADLLADTDEPLFVMAREVALGHHERWDGTGYPRGLAGTDIPESARIVAIADVFDALTSRRPYKPAWSIDDTVRYMTDQSGRHFDPRLLALFLEALPEIEAIRQRYTDADALANAPAGA